MAIPTHVKVTAPEGRKTPIHSEDGVEPGGGPLFAEPGKTIKVRWSQTTRRAVTRGDLVLLSPDGTPLKNQLDAAAAAWQEPPAKPDTTPAAKKGGGS